MGDLAQVAFIAGSLFVLPFWLLMIAVPGWSGTRRVMASTLVLLPLPILYTALLAIYGRHVVSLLQTMIEDPSGSVLKVIAEILGSDQGAAIAWVHFLAFDLFVGRWEYLDSRERGVPPLAMTPVLWATFLAGPVGLLLYLLVRPLLATKRSS